MYVMNMNQINTMKVEKKTRFCPEYKLYERKTFAHQLQDRGFCSVFPG